MARRRQRERRVRQASEQGGRWSGDPHLVGRVVWEPSVAHVWHGQWIIDCRRGTILRDRQQPSATPLRIGGQIGPPEPRAQRGRGGEGEDGVSSIDKSMLPEL